MKRFLVCTVAVLTVLSFGLVLIHCGGGGGDEKECKTTEDCKEGYWCDRTDWKCKKKDCIPDCTGKCCGDDGCGKPCPDICAAGFECDTNCVCQSTGCETDADCEATECCKGTPKTCTSMDCSDLQCGNDPVCGKECGPCQTGSHCEQGTCVQDVTCTTDDECADNECCIGDPKLCMSMACGALECGPDPVCGKECGPCPTGEACDNGVCVDSSIVLCPAGQECTQMGAAGSMACVIPPNVVPDTNQTDCAGDNKCNGNYACYCLDAQCTDSVCIENCGECPAGLECCELWPGGPLGCLTAGCVDVPANPPTCSEGNPCQGNAGCYTDGTNSFCIDNCSVDHSPCQNDETKCSGDIVQTCVDGAWEDTTDCTTNNQVCIQGACVTPAVLGEFCEDSVCEAGLDCIGTETTVHSFCTPECDCENQTECAADWDCLLSNEEADPTCWCAKLCTTADDCPDAGAGGFTCVVLDNDGTNDIFGCMVQ